MTRLLFKRLYPSSIHKFCNQLYVFGIYCFLVLFFSGCGTVAIINKNESDLMPKSVAISIFEKYGFKEWADKPFVANIGAFCGTEKEFIEFNQINTAIYLPRWKKLTFICINKKSSLCPQLEFHFENLTESQALELTNAARALGAIKIEKLQWNY